MRVAICSPAAASALARPRWQLCLNGRDSGVDLRVLRIHSVHQFRVEGISLTQQGKEQLVLASVVGVEEVQHLPSMSTDDLGSCTVVGSGADLSGQLAELAPDDAVDQNHLVGIDRGSAAAHFVSSMTVDMGVASRWGAVWRRPGHRCAFGTREAGIVLRA
jgi:hypothetical protein